MKRIRVIEDDPDIGEMIAIKLRGERYCVDIAADGAKGLERQKTQTYDLLIPDLMLPDVDGLEICRTVRGSARYQPIDIVSAKSMEIQRVLGLELGTDDYEIPGE